MTTLGTTHGGRGRDSFMAVPVMFAEAYSSGQPHASLGFGPPLLTHSTAHHQIPHISGTQQALGRQAWVAAASSTICQRPPCNSNPSALLTNWIPAMLWLAGM